MKQSTIIGLLLIFVTLLLVLGAAVFFLTGRNLDQGQELSHLAATQVALQATATGEIVVRQAAAETIRQTQEALAAQATQQAAQPPAGTNQADPTELAQSQFPAVVITQPQDQAEVAAGQPLMIVLAAQAASGLAEIRVAVNGLPLETVAGDDQPVLPAVISWTPPAAESYVIQAVAIDSQGQESAPAVLVVTAVFESQAAEDQARQQQLATALLATRFPEGAVTTEPLTPTAQPGSGPDPDLHQLLAAGQTGGDAEATAREALVLQAFELVPVADDFVSYVNNILSQPILGYYDPAATATAIFTVDQTAGPFAYWLAQHQLAHAYQSQRFQLDQIDLAQLTADQRSAVRALAEGEANWLQTLALSGELFSDTDKAEITNALAAAASDIFTGLPAFLEQDFAFAYRFGLPFVQALYEEGGPAALDEAWTSRPQSTEQILHPEKYLAQDSPQALTLLPLGTLLGGDWQLIDDGVLGEWRLWQHLSLHLAPEQAGEAAAGWGGDRYLLYWHTADDVPLLVLRLSWDTASDAAQFADLYPLFLAGRSGGSAGLDQANGGRCWLGSDVVCHYTLAGDQSLVVKAPNLTIANQIFEQLDSAS